MATITNIMSLLVAKKVQANDPISKAIVSKFRKVSPNTNLGLVSRILETEPYVLVTSEGIQNKHESDMRILLTYKFLYNI